MEHEAADAASGKSITKRWRAGALGKLLLAMAALSASTAAYGQVALSLTPSVPTGAPVGTQVRWTATADNSDGHVFRYRFLIDARGRSPRILKDFGPDNTLDWLPGDEEGFYAVQVTARDLTSGESATAVATYTVTSAVVNDAPTLRSTVHPLVYLYSAPACSAGGTMTVYFLMPGGTLQNTPAKACDGVHTMNFYLAGLRQSTSYYVKHIVQSGDSYSEGPVLTLTSGKAQDGLETHTKLFGDTGSLSQAVFLSSPIVGSFVATDLEANLIWYYPQGGVTLTRPEAGGRFLGFSQDLNGDQSTQILREIDLTGTTILETNAERVNEQLQAMGHQPINAFHHEARRLRNGNLVVLGGVEGLYTNVQDQGTIDVLGDMIIELDSDLNVVWAWNSFEHLDVARYASLDDQCVPIACPPTFLSPTASDWTHGNALAETPDGNLIYSTRSQDWVIKIDFQGGKGSGNILWKLGKEGDFTLASSDPSGWFSHQHDPNFLADGTFLVFDNGNVRAQSDPTAHSRGQAYKLDEGSMVATPIYNFDLGAYSYALGTAQKLDDGNFFFDNGFLAGSSGTSLEINPSGRAVYGIRSSAPEYRTFRLKDMYTP